MPHPTTPLSTASRARVHALLAGARADLLLAERHAAYVESRIAAGGVSVIVADAARLDASAAVSRAAVAVSAYEQQIAEAA